MPTPLGGELPAFDPAAKAPNSNINAYNEDAKPVALPTWDPTAEEEKADVRLARIHPNVLNGEEGAHDGSHPRHDERTAGAFPSDKLLDPSCDEVAVGPHRFARDGGTRRR